MKFNNYFLFNIIFIGSIQCMYDQGGKLKYDEVTLTNKSLIPLTLSWVEIKRPEGMQQNLKREILPGTTITVKLGEVGGYYRGTSAKIIYKPTNINESLTQEFPIDLPNSKAFAFTARPLAKIMEDIWVPIVFASDDAGNFNSFQYMNMQYLNQFFQRLYGAKQIK